MTPFERDDWLSFRATTYPTDARDSAMAPIVAGEVEICLRVSSIATVNAMPRTKQGERSSSKPTFVLYLISLIIGNSSHRPESLQGHRLA